jgi:hypothetical protein
MTGPQPLSRVNPHATTQFDGYALIEKEELAVYPMTVIAMWADIDRALAELLLLMLKSPDLSVGMAMYQALASSEAKRAALLAAAAAHHLWGVAKELPNALLLVDPKDWVKQQTAVAAFTKGQVSDALSPKPSSFVDRQKVMVFFESALQAEAVRVEDARRYVILLSFALDSQRLGDSSADQMRSMLLSAPLVRQEFRRLTSESAKAIRLQRRQQKHREKQERVRKSQQKAQRKTLWKKKT